MMTVSTTHTLSLCCSALEDSLVALPVNRHPLSHILLQVSLHTRFRSVQQSRFNTDGRDHFSDDACHARRALVLFQDYSED